MHHPAEALAPISSSLLFVIPLLPLVGAAINLLLGKHLQARMGKGFVHTLAIAMPAAAAIIAWAVVLPAVIHHRAGVEQVLGDWIVVGLFDARMAFYVDTLNCVMLLIITTVGTLIHIYSTGYMADEPSYWRFFGLLNIFMFAMLVLVLGDNFLLMFVGWEGVGFASWGLIGFWYRNRDNAVAGMKAFIVNRVGDFAFIIGMGLLFWGFQGSFTSGPDQAQFKISAAAREQHRSFVPGTHAHEQRVLAEAGGTEIHPVSSLTFRKLAAQLAEPAGGEIPDRVCEHGHCTTETRPRTRGDVLAQKKVWGMPLLFVVCVLFFIGATGKSAQIPLFVWLPDAMAGPTPVSALIHAATMVTAGVYMIARLNFLYALSPGAMTVVASVGALTALFAATIGFFQYDIKKVLAYSTVSQLGYMFIGVGVGAYGAGIFHLLTHACFKACLFLGSGSVIMGSHHNQDMRWMGGLKKFMPKTAWTYWAACVAISGFPIGAAYYSKDEILWKAFDSGNMLLPGGGLLIWLLGFVAATGTSFYMWRSYYVTFTGQNRHDQMPESEIHAQHAKHEADMGLYLDPESGALSSQLDDTEATGDDHPNATEGEPHAPFVPQESPLNVTLVLQILAVASLGIGVVLGFPVLWSHTFHLPIPNLFEHWLASSLAPSERLVDAAGYSTRIEWILAAASVGVATFGWLSARALYRNRGIPLADERLTAFEVKATLQALAQPRHAIPSEGGLGKIFDGLEAGVAVPMRLLTRVLLSVGALFGESFDSLVRGSHALVLDKYRIDELYDWLLVRRFLWLCRALSSVDRVVLDGAVNLAGWLGRVAGYISSAIDRVFVDGAVNGIAAVVLAMGNRIRHLQAGRVQQYLMGITGGSIALIILNYLLF